MEFPTRETDIESLARNLNSGLAAHTAVFPAPPVTAAALEPLLEQLDTYKQTLSDAEGAYKTAMTAKANLLEQIVDALKKDIRYAESVTNYDNDKLVLIGWGGRKEPTRQLPPGSPRDLLAEAQDLGRVNLSWRRPVQNSGGSVRAYRVHRRHKVNGVFGDWQEVNTALEPETQLTSQPEGTVLEFRVVSANTSGSSLPSNTVSVVL